MCGILVEDTRVVCWGRGYDGRTLPPDGRFDSISAYSRNACGIRRDQTLACWGPNNHGVLDVPAGAFTQVAVGSDFACALRDAGALACWGDGTGGVLDRPEDNFTAIAAAHDFACGILESGRTRCWGDHGAEASDYSIDRRRKEAAKRGAGMFQGHFVKITLADDTITGLGDPELCGLTEAGSIRCGGYWYPSWSPQWRFEDLTSVMVPDNRGQYIDVAFISASACTVSDSGFVSCDLLHSIGHAPSDVEPPGGDGQAYVSVAMIHAGGIGMQMSVCALRSDAAIDCWGSNDAGQADVPDGSFVAVELGGGASTSFACAIRTDGTLECWGNGGRDARRLPDSLRDPKSTPRELLPLVDTDA